MPIDPGDLAFLARVKVPKAEFRRGVGTGQQLPMGEAAALNRAVEEAPANPNRPAGPQRTGPQAPAPPASSAAQPQFTPTTDRDKFLFADTDFPDQPVRPLSRIPGDIDEWLPILMEEANRPNAGRTMREWALLIAANVGPAGQAPNA